MSAAALVRVVAAATSLLAVLLLALAACGAAHSGASGYLAPPMAAFLLTHRERRPALGRGLAWMATKTARPFASCSATGQVIGLDLRGDESLEQRDAVTRWSRVGERLDSLLSRSMSGR